MCRYKCCKQTVYMKRLKHTTFFNSYAKYGSPNYIWQITQADTLIYSYLLTLRILPLNNSISPAVWLSSLSRSISRDQSCILPGTQSWVSPHQPSTLHCYPLLHWHLEQDTYKLFCFIWKSLFQYFDFVRKPQVQQFIVPLRHQFKQRPTRAMSIPLDKSLNILCCLRNIAV